jgi:hypothetical protein
MTFWNVNINYCKVLYTNCISLFLAQNGSKPISETGHILENISFSYCEFRVTHVKEFLTYSISTFLLKTSVKFLPENSTLGTVVAA